MDRFVVRKPVSSPSTGDFSSDKPPTNGNSTTTATTSRSKASTIAERKFVATAAAQAASPRDLQLMRIFQPEHGSSTTTDKSKPAAAQLSTTAPNRLNRNVVINTPQHSVANRSTTSAVAVAGRAAVDVGSGDVFTFTGRPKDVTAAADRFGNNRQSDEQENRVPNFAHNTVTTMSSAHHMKMLSSGVGGNRKAAVRVASPAVKGHASSASATIRALQAQRCDAVQYFDVPAAEQDIRTSEEMEAAENPPPSTIQEVMRNVRVYVEVRSGADNRSHGIKTIIGELGAAVNDRLLRNTTHVIFKDGLLSTYQKAKGWNIPIVSILWIEACRRQVCLLNPAQFTISNVDRYEQPELYDKIRKQKSMQPYAEETRRRNVPKVPLPSVTGTAGGGGAVSMVSASSKASSSSSGPRISVPRKPKDNLPSIFGDFVKTLQQNGVAGVPKNSKLMDIIRNSPRPKGTSEATPTLPAAADETILGSAASSTCRTLFRSTSTDAATVKSSTPVRRSTRRQSMLSSSASEAISNERNSNSKFDSSTSRAKEPAAFSSVPEENTDDIDMEITDNKTQTPTKTTDKKTMPLLNSVLRRQTMYTPQSMQETMCGPAADNTLSSSVRRRTLFTPSQSDESTANRLDRLMSDDAASTSSASGQTSIDTTTPSTPIASSTNVEISNSIASVAAELSMSGTPCTPVFGVAAATIFEEYTRTVAASPTPFSSMRTPASHKRRTIFDMSMEIIDQRLQNINRQAMSRQNRSMSESDLTNDDADAGNKGSVGGGAANRNQAAQPPTLESAESCDATIMSATIVPTSSGVRKLGPILETSAFAAVRAAAAASDAPKKRKLYAPSASINFGLSDGDDGQHSVTGANVTQRNDAKRRRDAHNSDDTETASVSKKANFGPAAAVEKTTKPKATQKSSTSSQLMTANRRRTTMDLMCPKKPVTLAKRTAVVQRPAQQAGITGFLVSTNMHQAQITHINETVQKLGGFTQEPNVTARSTHLVSLEPLRTVNFLRGIIRGLWILRYEWIVESLAAGRWLPEEPFEVRDFSAAVSICRSERQSFGNRYQMTIFADMAAMCIVEANCACPNLRELVQLCGGRVTDDRSIAKYVISDVAVPVRLAGHKADAVCVRSAWILDSISIAKVKKLHAYLG